MLRALQLQEAVRLPGNLTGRTMMQTPEIELLEGKLEDFRHRCHLDWRELHELEELIDIKIALAFEHARAALQSTAKHE